MRKRNIWVGIVCHANPQDKHVADYTWKLIKHVYKYFKFVSQARPIAMPKFLSSNPPSLLPENISCITQASGVLSPVLDQSSFYGWIFWGRVGWEVRLSPGLLDGVYLVEPKMELTWLGSSVIRISPSLLDR